MHPGPPATPLPCPHCLNRPGDFTYQTLSYVEYREDPTFAAFRRNRGELWDYALPLEKQDYAGGIGEQQ